MARVYGMRLCEVNIKGYKSISLDNPVQLKLTDVNILLGANGAGKSNIVSFFKLLGFMMGSSLSRYVETEGTSYSLLHYGPKVTPYLEGELVFSDKQSIDRYRFRLSDAAPDRLIFTEETVEWFKKGKDLPYQVILEPNFKETALCTSKDRVVKNIYWLLSYCKVYQFHDSSVEGPLRRSCPIETSNYLQALGNNLPSFLYLLKNNYIESYNRIVSYVKDVVPQFRDFYLEPVGRYISLRWVDSSSSDYVFNAYQFSDGSIRFIALATLLLQPEETMPSVIILDEPELGLHPFAISQLSEMIKDASLHVQVILATQSKDLVDYFSLDNVSVVEMDSANQSTMVRQLSDDDYSHWLEEYSVSELWDKNVIGGQPL